MHQAREIKRQGYYFISCRVYIIILMLTIFYGKNSLTAQDLTGVWTGTAILNKRDSIQFELTLKLRSSFEQRLFTSWSYDGITKVKTFFKSDKYKLPKEIMLVNSARMDGQPRLQINEYGYLITKAGRYQIYSPQQNMVFGQINLVGFDLQFSDTLRSVSALSTEITMGKGKYPLVLRRQSTSICDDMPLFKDIKDKKYSISILAARLDEQSIKKIDQQYCANFILKFRNDDCNKIAVDELIAGQYNGYTFSKLAHSPVYKIAKEETITDTLNVCFSKIAKAEYIDIVFYFNGDSITKKGDRKSVGVSLEAIKIKNLKNDVSTDSTGRKNYPPVSNIEMTPYFIKNILSGLYKFNYEIKDKINISNTFDIKFDKAFSYFQPESGLASKPNLIQFYKINPDTTQVAYYWGNLKNGLADGYAFFAFVDAAQDTIVKQGFWSKGLFVNQLEAQSNVSKIVNEFNFLNALNHARPVDLKVKIKNMFYRYDELTPGFHYGSRIYYTMTWTIGNEKHRIDFLNSSNDFFQKPSISITGYSNSVANAYNLNKISNELARTQLAVFGTTETFSYNSPSLFAQSRMQGKILDEFTKVEISGWTTYYRETCTWPGGEIEKDWKALEFKTRNQIGGTWKNAYRRILYREEHCFGGRSLAINKKMHAENTMEVADRLYIDHHSFGDTDYAVDFVLEEMRKTIPYPVAGGYSIGNSIYAEKRNQILKRISNTTSFGFKEDDVMHGAWLDSVANKIYLIGNENSKFLRILPINYVSIFNEAGYLSSIIQPKMVTFNTEKVEYSQMTSGLGTSVLGTVTWYVAGIERNKITFSSGREWTRISLSDFK